MTAGLKIQSQLLKFFAPTDVYDDIVSRRDPNMVLLDARPHDMYTGEVIRHSIQGGHIPGAVNVVSLNGTDAQSQKWLSDEGLAELYKDFPKDKTVYIYCHDGFRMSLAYMQLKHLGVKDVRLYNGGWSHWGNELTLPVLEGDLRPWCAQPARPGQLLGEVPGADLDRGSGAASRGLRELRTLQPAQTTG